MFGIPNPGPSKKAPRVGERKTSDQKEGSGEGPFSGRKDNGRRFDRCSKVDDNLEVSRSRGGLKGKDLKGKDGRRREEKGVAADWPGHRSSFGRPEGPGRKRRKKRLGDPDKKRTREGKETHISQESSLWYWRGLIVIRKRRNREGKKERQREFKTIENLSK